jgi:hypothetical protein
MKRLFFQHYLSRSISAFMMALLALHFASAQTAKTLTAQQIDKSVIANLTKKHDIKPKVIIHMDLTAQFATASQWTLVAVQDISHPKSDMDFDELHQIFICLVKAATPDCIKDFYPFTQNDHVIYEQPYHLFANDVVYAGQNKSNPLLMLQMCGELGGNGNCGVVTALYRYDKALDRFNRIFMNQTGRNQNESTRLVESGPLQGDVIENIPTDNAPYRYWVTVYRAGKDGNYAQILRYRSITAYGDLNPLAVIDSDMPEILHRLGLWKPGDALPPPPHLPHVCHNLYMRNGEEWCK